MTKVCAIKEDNISDNEKELSLNAGHHYNSEVTGERNVSKCNTKKSDIFHSFENLTITNIEDNANMDNNLELGNKETASWSGRIGGHVIMNIVDKKHQGSVNEIMEMSKYRIHT